MWGSGLRFLGCGLTGGDRHLLLDGCPIPNSCVAQLCRMASNPTPGGSSLKHCVSTSAKVTATPCSSCPRPSLRYLNPDLQFAIALVNAITVYKHLWFVVMVFFPPTGQGTEHRCYNEYFHHHDTSGSKRGGSFWVGLGTTRPLGGAGHYQASGWGWALPGLWVGLGTTRALGGSGH